MTPERLRADLLTTLTETGALADVWRPAFEAVPRHEFVPDTVWRLDRSAGGRLVPLHRDTDPEEWLAHAYHDRPVDTQVDDGHPSPDGTGWEVTSSASQPTVVADMLRALEAEPGMRVLEIGTGTGWNAALLAHRLGAENVVTVEIDQLVAEQARKALDRAGYGKVTTVVGDGTDGWTDGAPYDGVIVTAGVSTVPYPWVAQTVPGGRIVVPLANTYQPPGIVSLTVGADGTATGRIGAPAQFMGLRSQRVPRLHGGDAGPADHIGSTELHPARWAGDRTAAMAVGQHLGDGIHPHYIPDTDTTGTMWLLEPASGSWATVGIVPAPPYPVEQGGPRRLFDEVAAAYRWWLDVGEPPLSAWLVTVGPEGQDVTLDPQPW